MSNFVTLLVEDDASQREAFADLLKDEGFEVIECATAEVAELIIANSKSNGSPGGIACRQTGTATEHSSADSPAGKMVAAGRHRLLQLPRGADKQFDIDRVPIPRHQSLAAHATAAEPERLDDLGGADQAVGRRLAPETANPSSVARESLRR